VSILQLHQHSQNPARNLAGPNLAGFPKNGRIPDVPEPEPNPVVDGLIIFNGCIVPYFVTVTAYFSLEN